MGRYEFTAVALEAEIDVARAGELIGMERKPRWEEPVILDPLTVTAADPDPFRQGRVSIYSFGSAVFFNCPPETVTTFFRSPSPLVSLLAPPRTPLSPERYTLAVDEGKGISVTNDLVTIGAPTPLAVDIVSFALAKSVALERIEQRLDQLLDQMEEVITRLRQGRFSLPDRELANLAGTILDFRYRSLSHLMILDPPEITWEEEDADRLYRSVAGNFELPQRFGLIRQKTDTLLDITDVFTTLAHARRSARLEWIIIILIALEIILFLVELFR
ncbi:MAG: RMD1 family protein [Desulfuromonadia bacterium]